MKRYRRLVVFCMAFLLQVGLIKATKVAFADGKYYYAEVCDGEVVEMQPLDYTYYIFPERNFDDLANKKKRTVQDIEKVIDHIVKLHPDSAFSGEAMSFIKASNETGLDPLFFIALAGIESAWGTNQTHLDLNNPYSIHMFGDGVNHGYKLGENFGEGIVEGAKFIYENYYKAGQTTLYLMNHDGRGHCYCDGDTNWEYQVGSEMVFLDGLIG